MISLSFSFHEKPLYKSCKIFDSNQIDITYPDYFLWCTGNSCLVAQMCVVWWQQVLLKDIRCHV